MATPTTKYLDNAGKMFDTEAEADASNAQSAYRAEVEEFVAKNFPTSAGSKRGNPHAGTAAKAIFMWIAHVETSAPVAG
jgi:hypothetical protein